LACLFCVKKELSNDRVKLLLKKGNIACKLSSNACN
jgi:transcription elongation factor Elf1